MGKRTVIARSRGRPARGLPAALLTLLAAFLLSAALATAAAALPTFTQAVGNVGPCDACHTETQVHGVPAHATLISSGSCSSCHVSGDVDTPPVPTACAACHGGTDAILAAHAGAPAPAAGCGSTPGCHGVPSVTAPTVTGFTPGSGPVGTTVTISGTGFQGATAVTFNGVAAVTFSVVSDTTITAEVPAAATSGPIAVTTPGGTSQSAGEFTVTAASSKISLKLAGLKAGVLRLGKRVTAKGAVAPGHAAKVKVTFQRKVSGKWRTVKAVTRASNATSGAYKYTYKPGKKGTWRVRAVAGKTVAYKAAASKWKTFKVK